MRSVLVIEDETDTREALAELLEVEGWKVHVAPHAEAALLALEGGLRPDVLLCDLFLPGRLGAELRANLAPHPELGRIPFVFMSASPGAVRAVPDGVALVKPLDLDRLLSTLAACVQR